MIEQVFRFSQSDDQAIEKILFDENVHYLHMVFPEGNGLPVHHANATVYMSVIRGELSIGLNSEEPRSYASGTLLKIPFGTRMDVRNESTAVLELIVIKAPAPRV